MVIFALLPSVSDGIRLDLLSAVTGQEKVRWVMKRLMMILALIGFSNTTSVSAPPASQDPSVDASASFGDADNFYGALAPYGEWLELDAGFYAWRPTHVRYGWRPYLHGRWAWTDYGWYWMSNEPFGWATCHYGRWYSDDNYGWVWVPDRTWGPAWVEWRYNDDYLGWAPLPPYASFSLNIGLRFTTRWFAPYQYWNFVRYRYMTSPYVYQEVVPIEYARRLISTTRSAGRYDYENGRIINRGVEREFVERRGGYTRIDRLDVRDSRDIGERFVRDRNTNRIEVYRPDQNGTDRTHGRIDARRVDGGTSLDLQKIERGRRGDSQNVEPRDATRDRRVQTPETRTPQDRVQQPEAARPRETGVQRRQSDRRIEVPQVPSAERKVIERRKEDRFPFPKKDLVNRSRSNEQRNVVVKPQRENRREVVAPRARNEETRPAPNVRKESPRGSEQGRREGAKRRN